MFDWQYTYVCACVRVCAWVIGISNMLLTIECPQNNYWHVHTHLQRYMYAYLYVRSHVYMCVCEFILKTVAHHRPNALAHIASQQQIALFWIVCVLLLLLAFTFSFLMDLFYSTSSIYFICCFRYNSFFSGRRLAFMYLRL